MAGSDPFWLLLTSVVLSRWLFGWAHSGTRWWIVIGICTTALLWLATPLLASLGGAEIEAWLLHYGKLIGVVVCIEAWLVYKRFNRHSYLSTVSLVALLYLLSKLFQSGQLAYSFDIQSLLYTGAILALGLLLRLTAVSRVDHSKLDLAHLVMVWLSVWLGLGVWPDNTGIHSTTHWRDTALLLCAIPLATAFSVILSLCWSRFTKPFRGV